MTEQERVCTGLSPGPRKETLDLEVKRRGKLHTGQWEWGGLPTR